MKRLFCLLLLLNFLNVFSQENKQTIDISLEDTKNDSSPKPDLNFTARSVEKMVILKECQSVDENNKSELQRCLADELKNRISVRFQEFDGIADSLKIETAVAKLQFVLDKEGKINEIKTVRGGNELLSEFILLVFTEMKDFLEFEPAQVGGKNVDMVFQLPIKYERNINSKD